MVEEDEGTNHALLCERQHAADFEAAAKVTAPLLDDHFNHIVSPDWPQPLAMSAPLTQLVAALPAAYAVPG